MRGVLPADLCQDNCMMLQVAFIGHDAGHAGVTGNVTTDTRLGLLVTAFLVR